MTLSVLFTLGAVLFFCLAAASVPLGGVPLVAVGLALFAAGHVPLPW